MPASPARNDPCPCGSGRKYKRCCMPRERTLALPAYSQRDRSAAFRKIERFARAGRFERGGEFASALFWAGRLELMSTEQREDLLARSDAFDAFTTWFIFDFDLGPEEVDDGTTGTIAERFLARPGVSLTAGEQTFLHRMSASSLRLYEIEAVRLDEGLSLHDLWTDERVEVRERLGTHELARWDLLAARVIEGEHGQPVIDGAPYLLPATDRDEILAELRRHHRRLVKRKPHLKEVNVFFKHSGMVFNHLWLDHVVMRPLPEVVTTEGDRLAFTASLFDLDAPIEAAARLEGHAAFAREEDGSLAWHDATQPDRILGRVAIAGRRLTLETLSEERAERGRRLLEAVLGGAIRFRMTRTEDARRAAEASRAGAAERPGPVERASAGALPAELEQAVIAQVYERHYRAWLDDPIPALGGRTPRHAVRLKTVRPKLVNLLKDIENGMERERMQGRPAADLGWLWEELGVERG